MSEENKIGPKKSWTRIFRKKWFFPSLYLILAALLISAVVWYQNDGEDQVVVDDVEVEEESDDYSPILNEEPAEPVMGEQEVIELPLANPEEAEVITKFFDYDADESDQVNALIHYNNRYYQSTGIDIATNDGEPFEVTASLSGTVSEVKEDPLLGNVVIIDHDEDVRTFYASLAEVNVEPDTEVIQGDVLGTSGMNTFGKDLGNHVHFEIRKGETAVNPEIYITEPLASLDSVGLDEAVEETAEQPSEGDNETPETEEPIDESDSDIEDELEEDSEDSEQDDDVIAEDEEDSEDEEQDEEVEE